MLSALEIPIAPKGLATAFEPTETPVSFALKLRNRTISAAGGAVKRQGIVQLGANVPGNPKLTHIHELIDNKTALEKMFVSGKGKIWSYNEISKTWQEAYSGADEDAILRSVQCNDKLIFYNGVNRPFYTTNGIVFRELKPIVEAGISAIGTDRDSLQDADIIRWQDTGVSIGDIIEYQETGAIACITGIATASVQHTQISSTAPSTVGIIGDGYDLVSKYFRIIDTVEANCIPTSDPEEDDNIAVAIANTSATGIKVAAVSEWTNVNFHVGDFIRNTTRSAIAIVTAISTGNQYIRTTGVSGQTTGDSLVFYKSAMPKPSYAHLHYGRMYYVDSEDRSKIRISGPNNPQDMTTDSGTWDSTSFSFGALQPEGDTIQALTSYQRFMIMSGKRYTFLYEGTDPISDTSGMKSDFSIVGMFPQGIYSPDGLLTVGNDAVIVSSDGIQGFSMQGDASSVGRENLSEAIKNILRKEIGLVVDPNEIIAWHYPKRSWIMAKIRNKIYVYNYTPFFGEGGTSSEQAFSVTRKGGSWSVFDGKFAEQNAYYVSRNGKLYACGNNGKVYECDVDDVYTDDGDIYTTEYQTTWLKGSTNHSQEIKIGFYVQPVFNCVNTTYTIYAEAPFNPNSNDEFLIGNSGSGPIGTAEIGKAIIGGAGVIDEKIPLMWRGKEVRFTIQTSDSGGPDNIARLVVFFKLGKLR